MMTILLLLEPNYFQEVGWLDNIFDVGKLIVLIILILEYVLKKIGSISYIYIMIILLHSTYLFSSIYNGVHIWSVLLEMGYVIAFISLVELIITKDSRIFVDAVTTVLSLMIIVNFLSFKIFPEGMYNNGIFDNCWLLGYKNGTIQYFLPDMFFLKMKEQYHSSDIVKHERNIVFLSGLAFAVGADSMTTIIAIVGWLVVNMVIKQFHFKISLIPFILGSYFVAFDLMFGNLFILTQNIIYKITGRNLTWTVRKMLWDFIAKFVKKHPIIGNGVLASPDFSTVMGKAWMVHAHNTYLQVLFQGGILATILFGGIFIYAAKKVQNNDIKIYRAFFSVIIIFLLIFQSEWYSRFYLIYAILIFGVRMGECRFETKKRPKGFDIKFY